jgi:DNA-binding FadR family transcriptional regulator
LLRPEDVDRLERLVAQAWEKLRGSPIQIPHAEHKALHLTVFSRLPNQLVRALIEAYWEAYEAVGLSLFADYAYLREVWTYHEVMVTSIRAGDYEAGLQALVRHTGLLRTRSEAESEIAGAQPANAKGAVR